MSKIWNSANDEVEVALELPEGSYCADFGFLVQQGVNPDHVLKAATALKEAGKSVVVASQAGVIVKAQEEGVAFQDWARVVLA